MRIRNTEVQFPIYLPDATRAVAKSLDSRDLAEAHVEAVVVNTFHLATNPGTTTLEAFGGVKKFMNFNGLVTSDSGGWQVFSLIHRNKTGGKITDEGVVFSIGNKDAGKSIFTPEQSIRTQFSIGSDIIICLDDFTPPDATPDKIKESVDRTILWAKKSKIEFEKIVAEKGLTEETRPILLAVIQGGWSYEMRKYCAEKLIEIGFDAYGFGGYVIREDTKKMDLELSKFIADLIPNDKIKFALGVGNPHEIAMCAQMGWQIFDCTLPTRDARHKRLYVFNPDRPMPSSLAELSDPDFYKFIYIDRTVFSADQTPVSSYCDCALCKNYTKAYLHHLFEIPDTSAYRLATIHNLRFYTMLIEILRNL